MSNESLKEAWVRLRQITAELHGIQESIGMLKAGKTEFLANLESTVSDCRRIQDTDKVEIRKLWHWVKQHDGEFEWELEDYEFSLQQNPYGIETAQSGNEVMYWQFSGEGNARECLWRISPNCGGYFEDPYLIVIHYTAGRSFERTTKLFLDSGSSKSAHMLISKADERPIQFVPFNKRAWSCGKSVWEGRESVNGFSINIEFDNYGRLESVSGSANRYKTYFGEILGRNEVSLVGNAAWEKYSRHQIETGAQVVQRLIDGYPSITHVIGHCDVSPGRKIDPGYAFPWSKFENLVNRPAILFSSGF